MNHAEAKLVLGGLLVAQILQRHCLTVVRSICIGQQLLWSEQASPENLDSIVWPRAASSAEVFWTGATLPDDNLRDVSSALPRLHDVRYRMVRRGIRAIALQPHWCALRPGVCGLDASVDMFHILFFPFSCYINQEIEITSEISQQIWCLGKASNTVRSVDLWDMIKAWVNILLYVCSIHVVSSRGLDKFTISTRALLSLVRKPDITVIRILLPSTRTDVFSTSCWWRFFCR